MIQEIDSSTQNIETVEDFALSSGVARAFGDMVQARLDERGWSMRDFAQRLDPKRSVDSLVGYASKIISGKVAPPRKTIDRWADALRFDGVDRKRFLFLAALAKAPEDIESIVLGLESEVEDLRRRLRGGVPPPRF